MIVKKIFHHLKKGNLCEMREIVSKSAFWICLAAVKRVQIKIYITQLKIIVELFSHTNWTRAPAQAIVMRFYWCKLNTIKHIFPHHQRFIKRLWSDAEWCLIENWKTRKAFDYWVHTSDTTRHRIAEFFSLHDIIALKLLVIYILTVFFCEIFDVRLYILISF